MPKPKTVCRVDFFTPAVKSGVLVYFCASYEASDDCRSVTLRDVRLVDDPELPEKDWTVRREGDFQFHGLPWSSSRAPEPWWWRH